MDFLEHELHGLLLIELLVLLLDIG